MPAFDLSRLAGLSDADVTRFRRDGFLIVERFLSEERIDALRESFPKLFAGNFFPNTGVVKSHFYLPGFDWTYWRGAVAKEQGMPAYVIFHDATLRQIATQRPTSLADLGTVSGVGENKLAKYGEGVLEVLAGD